MTSGSTPTTPRAQSIANELSPTTSTPPATPLIGRQLELAAIQALLDQPGTRMLTLTGSDGVGKTRLAIATAQDATEAVTFVSLAFASSEALVISSIAQALGAGEPFAEPLLDGLMSAFQAGPALLMLDGAEHASASSAIVSALLDGCPELRVLVTATSPLGVDGERVYEAPPLTLPSARNWRLLSEDERGAAVALFVERASAAQPEFAVTMANAVAVAEICRRLDGLPLAIEIVASRSRSLPPQLMLARLDGWLPKATDGATTPERRDEILRGVIAWSYSQLEPTEQELLRGLAVFANGATAGAAATVAAGDDIDARLAALVAADLVQLIQDEHTGTRYSVHDPVRTFALDLLAATGEAGGVRQRHADWALDLARQAEIGLRAAEQRAWLARLEREIDNLRTALKWYFTSGQPDNGVALASALTRFWAGRAQVSEGWRWIERGLASPTALSPGARARAISDGSWLALLQGRFDDANRLAAEALAVYREVDDPDGIATSLDSLGELALTAGDYTAAVARFEESMAIWTSRDRRWSVGMTLISFACATLNLDQFDRSRDACNDARAIWKRSVISAERRWPLSAWPGWNCGATTSEPLMTSFATRSRASGRLAHTSNPPRRSKVWPQSPTHAATERRRSSTRPQPWNCVTQPASTPASCPGSVTWPTVAPCESASLPPDRNHGPGLPVPPRGATIA